MTGSPDRILNLLHRDDAVSSVLAFYEGHLGSKAEFSMPVMASMPPVERLPDGWLRG